MQQTVAKSSEQKRAANYYNEPNLYGFLALHAAEPTYSTYS